MVISVVPIHVLHISDLPMITGGRMGLVRRPAHVHRSQRLGLCRWQQQHRSRCSERRPAGEDVDI